MEKKRLEVEENLLKLWDTVLVNIDQRFGIKSPLKGLSPQIVSDERSDWPSSWDSKIEIEGKYIFLSNLVETPEQLRKAILSREALFNSLPQGVIPQVFLFDISCEYAIQQLDSEYAEKWATKWKKSSPDRLTKFRSVYKPEAIFSNLRKLSMESGLNQLVDRILQLESLQLDLSIEQWNRYLYRFVRTYPAELNDVELQIVDILLRTPDASREDIAQQLDLSTNWVGKTILDLRKKRQLREFQLLSFAALGIRVFHVILLSKPQTTRSIIDFIKLCPFVFSIHRLIMGSGGIFATLCIPDNKTNIEVFESMLQLAKEKGIIVRSIERNRVLRSFNFQSYSTDSSSWDIDWDRVSLEMSMIQESNIVDAYPLAFSDPPERITQCDHVDAHILVLFQRGITSIRNIRKVVKKRTSEIVKRVNRLRRLGVIKHLWELHHVGLNDNTILFTEKPLTENILSVLPNLLPYCYVDKGMSGKIAHRLRLPSGNSIDLASVFQDITSSPEIYPLGERIYGSWILSDFINEWNSYHGTWDIHEDRIHHWMHSLEHLW
ncbi:MAG: hypothetical protein GF411_20285 [Candidatus Lokiarchaeota archaeon]|nr:hypothetical protein [Candidatus Lokiarchaeota archaeon]